MKIILAVDGSACSEFAVEQFIRRSLPEQSAVKIISVVELPFTPTEETRSLPDSDYSRLERAETQKATAAVERAVHQVKTMTGTVPAIESAVLIGNAEDSILDEAERWQADLIVIGSHGYRGWKKFWLGSVAQAIASRANCSVEIIRQRQPGD